MHDYVPANDAEFALWLASFAGCAQSNAAAFGLSAGEVSEIVELAAQLKEDFSNHTAAHAASRAAYERKRETRKRAEKAARALTRRLQASAAVSDDDRVVLRITVADGQRTKPALIEGRPLAVVDASERLRHIIRFSNVEGRKRRVARPKGAMGCEVWAKVGGAAPAGPEECRFLALQPATPFLAEYPGEQGGQWAHYMLRWVNTRGERGPWSETASAVIGG